MVPRHVKKQNKTNQNNLKIVIEINKSKPVIIVIQWKNVVEIVV